MALDWQEPAFESAVRTWLAAHLAERRLELSGEPEQVHVAWWSTVYRVPTDGGTLWLKASRDRYEAALTRLLAALRPRSIVELVAVDAERGWTLARDAGTRLRDVDDGTPPAAHWEQLLPEYAELQMRVVARVPELLAVGVPDRRLRHLPDALGALLDEPEMLLRGQPDGLSDTDRQRLRRALPDFADACRRLTEIGLPETIQHDDLNDGNVWIRDGRHVVFDWGDACISHPFHTLVVTLRAAAHRLGWAPGGPEVRRLLDAYLEPWRRVLGTGALHAAADLARRTGTIQRALAWRAYAAEMPAEIRPQYVDAVPYGLRLYLADGPWGSWDDGTVESG